MLVTIHQFLSNEQTVKAFGFSDVQKVLEVLCDSPWTYERIRREISNLLTTMFSSEELTQQRMECLRFTFWNDIPPNVRMRMDFVVDQFAFPNILDKTDFDIAALYVGSITLLQDRSNLGGVANVLREHSEHMGELSDWGPVFQMVDSRQIAPMVDRSYDQQYPLSLAARNLLGALLQPHTAVFDQQQQPAFMNTAAQCQTECYLRPGNGPSAAVMRPDQYTRKVGFMENCGELALGVYFLQEGESLEDPNVYYHCDPFVAVAQIVYQVTDLYRACAEMQNFLIKGVVPAPQPAPHRSVVIEEVQPDREYAVSFQTPEGYARHQRCIPRDLSTIGFDVVRFFTTGHAPLAGND